MTLFVPSGAIRCAADSKVQITHNHTPNTEIAYLTGMAKNNKNSKQSIYGKSISYLCFVLELRSKMAAGTKECLYGVHVAQWLEHCVSSAKVVGSIPREHMY